MALLKFSKLYQSFNIKVLSKFQKIKGDMRILELLIQKDDEAVKNIGDPSVWMGVFDIDEEEKITTSNIENGNWKSLIRPEMMNALIISPEKMSTINLGKFIKYLKLNNQKVTRYEIAFWEKLMHPIMPLVMLIFAIPFGFLQERSGGKYLKMFLGIIIGITYQILNTMTRHIGLLNDWQPFISSLIPTIIFLSIGLYLISKFERL